MMENQTLSHQVEQNNQESTSSDKKEKYLMIAKRAKEARDEALKRNASLQEENVNLQGKVSNLEKQLKTSQEMLVALTDQKLNLAMELDDVKKSRAQTLQDIMNMAKKCEKWETEAENYKRQYDKVLSENEVLQKLKAMNQKLLAGAKRAKPTQDDLKKLHENNENVKTLLSNVSKEKKDLEEQLSEATNKLTELKKDHKKWYSFLSGKYSLNTDKIDAWINCLENQNMSNAKMVETFPSETGSDEEKQNENSKLKEEIKMLKESLSSLLIDKENFESELAELNRQNEQLNCRLEMVNQDRDKMVKNFEEVRVETRQLIENSEKLSQDLEVLKTEKNQVELELSATNYERNVLEQDLIEKRSQMECLLVTLKNSQSENDDLQSELSILKEEVTKLNILLKNSDGKLESDVRELNEKYLESVKELNEQQILNQNLTQEMSEEKSKLSELMEQIILEQNKCLTLNDENGALKDELIKLEKMLKDININMESNRSNEVELRNGYESLIAQNQELGELKNNMRKELEESQVEKNQLLEENKKIQTEKDELENSSKKLKESVMQCEQILSESKAENKKLLEELQSIKETMNSDIVNDYEDKVLNLTKEKDELHLKVEAFETEILNLQQQEVKYQTDFKNLQKIASNLESVNNSLTAEITGLKQEIAKLSGNLKEVSSHLLEKNKHLEEINLKNKSLENYTAKLESDLEISRSEVTLISEKFDSSNRCKQQISEELEWHKNIILEKESLLCSVTEEMGYGKKKLEELENELEYLKREDGAKSNEVSRLRTECETHRVELVQNKDLIDNLKKEIIQSLEELKEKCSAINSLEKKLVDLDQSKTSIAQTIEKLTAENDNLQKKLSSHLSDENEKDRSLIKLSEELEFCKSEIKDRFRELEKNNRIWVARMTALKGGLVGLKHANEDTMKHFQEMQNYCASHYPMVMEKIQDVINRFVEHTVVSSKHELLAEMQHMNQALKERGEVISKLQETISENKSTMKKISDENQELHNDLQQIKHLLSEKEDHLKNKEWLVKELEHEISRMKDNQDNSTDGDMMSSSTISKAEELGRLKDIEESFEDKYAKLRYFTAKLKKRLTDVSHAYEADKIKMAAERSELMDKIQNLSSAAKTAQKVQESCDRILDELEEEKKKTRSLQLSLDNSLKSEESEKSKVAVLEVEVKKFPGLKKQIENLEYSLKEAKKEIQNLQKEKKVEVIKYDELKKESIQLEKKISELSFSLEQAKHQGKATNVLELEIQNYEKTIADLSCQLSSEKDHSKHLQGELDTMRSLNNGLEEQIKLLEGRISVEEERNLYINDQLKANNQKIGEMQSQAETRFSTIHNLQKDLQNEKSRCETLLIESSAIGSEFKKREIDLLSQVDNLQRHVNSMESALSSTTQDLESSRSEIEHLQNEFDSYRIRAQSVLAKQKSDIITQGEKEAREQMEVLNSEIQILRQKLDSAIADLDAVKTESSLYLSEKEKAEKRLEELSKIVHSKTRDNDQLHAEFRAHKISMDTLIQSYKTKLEEKDFAHKKEVEEERRKFEEFRKQMIEKEAFIYENEVRTEVVEGSFSPLSPQNEVESLPPEREDGEGSESVPSPKTRRKSVLVPLDVLLNSPLDEESRMAVLNDQVQKLRNEITGYEVRTRHLSSLLSEAEKDSARNAQLNAVLKEEVRRLERSLEREPHAKNTEYLKNIVFKFLTLHSGDERMRLIPVLDTILKLSPEETHKLTDIAKGEKISSWGNYLPSWTGL